MAKKKKKEREKEKKTHVKSLAKGLDPTESSMMLDIIIIIITVILELKLLSLKHSCDWAQFLRE